MAQQNKLDAGGMVYSEILSPSELFAARSRSHKIPIKGQKNFFPDDSDEQQKQLEQSLNEHCSLLSEERVERLGTLVKATWISSKQVVELQSLSGKFWQTMGFSAEGKRYLLPEEALYLMECGSLQVFYEDLALSIQDAYEIFLSSETVSLHQYQVFGHLKRLGYVVHRFDPSSLPSRYAQQLNLPQSGKNAGNQLKRKHDVSLTSTSAPSLSKTLVPTTDTMSADEHMKDESVDESVAMTSSEPTADESSTTDSAVMVEPRKWWTSDIIEDKGSNHRNCSRSGWDFSSILFPDLGSKENLSGSLASPDPSLLPGALAVGVCDVASWRSKINQRKVKGSPEHRRRGVDNQRQGWHGKKDEEVQSCKNWTEFNDLMARHQHRRQDEQAEHLWNREVTPLHDPSQPLPTRELLDICSVIKPTCLLEGASRLKPAHEWRISFAVYQPDTASEFKKSKPRKPYTHVCVCGFDGPVPELQTVKLLTSQSGDVPVVFAVVDHGDVSFYTMKDFELPTDVFL